MMEKVQEQRKRFMDLLDYDKDTGVFWWKLNSKGKMKGRVAGTPNNLGYVQISIGNKRYLAARLAWLFVYGQWPEHNIDHINRDKADNRISNLRDVPQSENLRNRKNWKVKKVA